MANTPVDPDAGLLALTGLAPVVSQPQHSEPDTGVLTLTGFAPSVTQVNLLDVFPDTGLMTLAGLVPTVMQTDNGHPGVGVLTLAGLAPSVTQSNSTEIAPAAGTLTITGRAPTVTQVSGAKTANPSTGSLLIIGLTPTVTQSINGVVPGSPESYSALITSGFRKKPKFKAVVELLVSGLTDGMKTLLTMPVLYDFSLAIGSQLDNVGTWIGLSRIVPLPAGAITLSDADYRLLLTSKIAANHYDGSFEQYQLILSSLFQGNGTTLIAVDNQDMSIDIYVLGNPPTAVQLQLMQQGFLPPKPEGVRINGFILIGDTPIFGLDHDDAFISGPDVGAFINYL